ncbi:Similar to Pentatricopeptide repeat-containing protein At1g62930, chloroplastic; acc. no. Q9LQ14 [Pyronema omphalodes CBS 100304]|nr:Similar to Pentatricopeptide repeat-containing protein At1g62930, chloroplastic; acc. no. Q9LQ14 [Pyronema omphalodes CBS 100304]
MPTYDDLDIHSFIIITKYEVTVSADLGRHKLAFQKVKALLPKEPVLPEKLEGMKINYALNGVLWTMVEILATEDFRIMAETQAIPEEAQIAVDSAHRRLQGSAAESALESVSISTVETAALELPQEPAPESVSISTVETAASEPPQEPAPTLPITGIPSAIEFIEYLSHLGFSTRRLVVGVLCSLVAKEAPPSMILPIFETSILQHLQSLEGLESADIEYMFRLSNELYVVYLYLEKNKAESAAITTIQNLITYHMNLPLPGSINKIMGEKFRGASHRFVKNLAYWSRSFILRNSIRNRILLMNSLERFVETNDLTGMQDFYRKAIALDGSPKKEWMYSCFIATFLRLHRARSFALSVWEDMIQASIIPGVDSWNVVLRAGQATDHSSLTLLDLWNRMIKTGVMPDHHCWVTRIDSQFLSNQVTEGFASLAAMQEAGISWTTETVNAAVKGLLKHNHFEHVKEVMAQADSKGVAPDIITYNTLLSGIIKQGNYDAIRPLLKHMVERGVATDVYTLTIVIDGIFNLKNQPETFDPHTAAIEFFTYFEDLGIHGNVATYTALTEGLLEAGNLDAVQSVRQIMRDKSIEGNADYYTVLLKGAFLRNDLAAVPKLWQEIRQRSVRRDHILWFETIYGYACHGVIVEMEEYLQAMEKEPEPTVVLTLKAYVLILRQLEKKGELRAARKIVEGVCREWDQYTRLRSVRVDEEFWELAGMIGGRGWAEGERRKAAVKAGVARESEIRGEGGVGREVKRGVKLAEAAEAGELGEVGVEGEMNQAADMKEGDAAEKSTEVTPTVTPRTGFKVRRSYVEPWAKQTEEVASKAQQVEDMKQVEAAEKPTKVTPMPTPAVTGFKVRRSYVEPAAKQTGEVAYKDGEASKGGEAGEPGVERKTKQVEAVRQVEAAEKPMVKPTEVTPMPTPTVTQTTGFKVRRSYVEPGAKQPMEVASKAPEVASSKPVTGFRIRRAFVQGQMKQGREAGTAVGDMRAQGGEI